MIIDSLNNAGLYENIHPRFKKAFDFLRTTDLNALPVGKIEIDGAALFVNVVEIEGKTPETAKMETHLQYMDIQLPLTATETMGWLPAEKLCAPTEPYSQEKDIAFFADKAFNLITVRPSEFVVFFPGDAHQPGIADGKFKKIIVKVLV